MRNRIIQFFGVLLLFLTITSLDNKVCAQEADSLSKEKIEIQHIIFSHTDDSYEWHITNIGEKEIIVPLPVILYSKTSGWNVFMSSCFHENGGVYKGFYISNSEKNSGKIVEKDSQGNEIRPLNFSISKDVFELLLVVCIVMFIVLHSAKWYKNKKPSDDAPKGFVGFMEMFIMSINDDVIKSSIGEKHYKKYSPYLLTVFFFIFASNLMGIIPIFPAGANITGNIAITFFLAICTFLATNLFGNKHYWKDIFWPEVPTWLKCPVPMMPLIEFFGVFTKPFALMVRLFANILAGHAIIISLVCIIFITFQMGVIAGTSLTVVSVAMTIFMDFLELLVAFIQAYVFTMLSAVFIGLAHLEPEHK